jgi:predicted phosphoadenosine phosphosulfate sulfurtransferase
MIKAKIAQYIKLWKARGYPDDIPDTVPGRLAALGLAPSYEQICYAILTNDHCLKSLGFAPPASAWYTELKRIEIMARNNQAERQEDLFK